jgi:hypothetical protein
VKRRRKRLLEMDGEDGRAMAVVFIEGAGVGSEE